MSSSGGDVQAVVTALSTCCAPRTDTDALVLLVQAACLLEGDYVVGSDTAVYEGEGACSPLHTFYPLGGTGGVSYPAQRYHTRDGGIVTIKPTAEQNGTVLVLHGYSQSPSPTRTHTHTHTKPQPMVQILRLSLCVSEYVVPHGEHRGDVHVVHMRGHVRKLRSRLVTHLLSKLCPSLCGAGGLLPSLTSLPPPLTRDALTFLSAHDVMHFSQTCKAMRAAAVDPTVWAFLLRRDYPDTDTKSQDATAVPSVDAYRARYQHERRRRRCPFLYGTGPSDPRLRRIRLPTPLFPPPSFFGGGSRWGYPTQYYPPHPYGYHQNAHHTAWPPGVEDYHNGWF